MDIVVGFILLATAIVFVWRITHPPKPLPRPHVYRCSDMHTDITAIARRENFDSPVERLTTADGAGLVRVVKPLLVFSDRTAYRDQVSGSIDLLLALTEGCALERKTFYVPFGGQTRTIDRDKHDFPRVSAWDAAVLLYGEKGVRARWGNRRKFDQRFAAYEW